MEAKLEKTIIDNKVIVEMIETEKSYNNTLTLLNEGFSILENVNDYPLLVEFKNQLMHLKTISDALLMHSENAVNPLVSEEQHIAYRMQRMQLIKAFFEVYKKYVLLFDEYAKDKTTNPDAYKNLELYVRKNSSSLLDLEGLLIQPVQRGPRYSLLAKEAKKNPDYLTENNQKEFIELELLIKDTLFSINSALRPNSAKEAYYFGKYTYETGLFIYSSLFSPSENVTPEAKPQVKQQDRKKTSSYKFGDGTRYLASLLFSSESSSSEDNSKNNLSSQNPSQS